MARLVAPLVSAAFNVQNFKRAEQHLSSAIELDPENHVFYSNRGCNLHSDTHPRHPQASHAHASLTHHPAEQVAPTPPFSR